MKRIFFLLILCLAGCAWWDGGNQTKVYGSGSIIKEERPIDDIHSFVVQGMGTVKLSQNDTESLIIETDENLMPYIKSEVSGHTLKIKIDNANQLKPTNGIVYHLTVKKIKGIELLGAVNVEATMLRADKLAFKVMGASKIDVPMNVKELYVNASGAATYNLSGTAEDQRVKLSGAGLYNAAKLVSREGDIDVSGSVRATVNVSDTLKIDAQGAAQVEYLGDPKVKLNVSGVAAARRIG